MPIQPFMPYIVPQKEIIIFRHAPIFVYSLNIIYQRSSYIVIYPAYIFYNLQLMLHLSSKINTKLFNLYNLYQLSTIRQKNAHVRIKHYSKYPDQYKFKTLIRPPNLNQPDIEFPIKIPMRYRFIRRKKQKQLLQADTSKIHWERLEPNQILLGLEHPEYLSFHELTDGLKYLSEVAGQEQHNWNEHEWVSKAMNVIRDKFNHIKNKQIMKYYWLMKKLNYTDTQFWGKMYKKIQQQLYEMYQSQFQYIFLEYYQKVDQVFSSNAKHIFLKLMEGRIRQFKPASIIKIFEMFHEQKKLDTYWLENVFISLFKNQQYKYKADQIAKIFRVMMLIDHEEDQRLYSNLYARIQELEFTSPKEIDHLEEVLLEVKELFISHRVERSLEILGQKRNELKLQQKEEKKTLEQKVKDDLRYYIQKQKLKKENIGAQ